MTKAFPQKIHIIGSVGSGKTTLARKLSKTLQIPYYELDNVAWMRKESGDILRTDEEKGALTNHSPNEQLDYRGDPSGGLGC